MLIVCAFEESSASTAFSRACPSSCLCLTHNDFGHGNAESVTKVVYIIFFQAAKH